MHTCIFRYLYILSYIFIMHLYFRNNVTQHLHMHMPSLM